MNYSGQFVRQAKVAYNEAQARVSHRSGLDNCYDMIFAVEARGILYWQRDPDSTDGEPRGRAWVIEADGRERHINRGDPISRSEAERLAQVGEYTLDAEA